MNSLPPLEYLFGCSTKSLQQIQLASLDRFAQHLKQAKSELAEAAIQYANASIAEWFAKNREKLVEAVKLQPELDAKAILSRFELPEPYPPALPEPIKAKPRWPETPAK